MKFLKSFFLLLGLIFIICDQSVAQTPIQLEEAIKIAKSSNRSIRIAHQSIEVQKATYEQTKSHFLPYFGVQLTDIATNNPLNVFGFKLLQESIDQSDFNPELLNDPNIRNQFNLSFNAMMPLFNPEARAEQEAVISQIKMKESMAQRTAQGIELEVVRSYYMLLLSQKVEQVMEETLAAAQSNYSVANNYYAQGLLLKSDLLDMEIMVNQSELALGTAKMNVVNNQSHFNHVLNTQTNVNYIPTDTLLGLGDFIMAESELNLQRADFKAINHGIQAMQLMNIAVDKSFLPKLKAFGSFELNDEIPFENRANNFQLGITLGWDIYKGNINKSTIHKNKAEIKEKQLELEKNIASAKLDINKTQRAIEDIKSQIKLHDLSIKQAKQALKIRQNRFKQGLEKSTDIINAETQLSHKKLARLNSLFQLNIKKAYLQFLLN